MTQLFVNPSFEEFEAGDENIFDSGQANHGWLAYTVDAYWPVGPGEVDGFYSALGGMFGNPSAVHGTRVGLLNIPTLGSVGNGLYQVVAVAPDSPVRIQLSFGNLHTSYAAPYPQLTFKVIRQDTSAELFSSTEDVLGDTSIWQAFDTGVLNVVGGDSAGVSIEFRITFDENGSGTFDGTFFDAASFEGTAPGGEPPPPPPPPPTIPPDECPPGNATYALVLRAPNGDVVDILSYLISFSFTRIVCAPGSFEVVLPRFPTGTTAIAIDSIVEIWRGLSPDDSVLVFVGFVERVVRQAVATINGAGGLTVTETIILSGTDPNGLLKRRVVNAAADDAEGTIAGTIDDLMKLLVRDHFGSGAIAARRLPVAYFAVEADASAGATTGRTVAARNVLEVIADLQEESRNTTEVLWEVRWNPIDALDLTFRTALSYLGIDRTSKILFGSIFGTVRNAQMDTDATDSANIIHYEFGTFTDDSTLDLVTNPWARREVNEDVRTQATAEATLGLIQTTLDARRVRDHLTAELVDFGTRYGCGFDVGDLIKLWEFNREWIAVIRSVSVSYSEGKEETIDAGIEAFT